MKKGITGAVVVIGGVAALRRFGPTIEQRAMKRCHDMMAQHGGCPMNQAA
jgi:hypothetical protein